MLFFSLLEGIIFKLFFYFKTNVYFILYFKNFTSVTVYFLGLGRYTETSMYQGTWPDNMCIDTCYVVSIF